ncbi:MAG TPA: penicillin acylase family protein, partial [Actinomycetota bacterium]|nr:penicillin acylase family protein [Actinomycetota bacterium]
MRRALSVGVVAALTLAAMPQPSAAQPGAYRAGDGAVRAFSILPPGQGRHPTLVEFMQASAGAGRPHHTDDQLTMYESLVRGAADLRDEDITTYFKDASFGVRSDDIARAYSPSAGVTIVRDRSFGVPHVYG